MYKSKKINVPDPESASTSIHFPGSKSSDDNVEKHPLEVFPSEVWCYLFEHVKNSNDLITFSRASDIWNKLLKPKATKFLFPEVLSIIADNMDKRDILNCRQVCVEWKMAIDTYLQNHNSHFALDTHHYDNCISAFRPWFMASAPVEIESFVQKHFQTNPFISRSIGFEDTVFNEAESVQFWSTVRDSLLGSNSNGAGIWYCDLELATNTQRSAILYKNVCDCLALMNNIKVLQIAVLDWDADAETAFPKLPSLVSLRCISLPTQHVNTILKCNPHVKNLMVEKHLNAGKKELMLQFDCMEELEKLSIFSITNAEVFQLRSVSWPLKSLCVSLNYGKEIFDLREVFNVLKQFESTLSNLKIEIFDFQLSHERIISSSLRLHLPHLEILSLRLVTVSSLDFILPLISLRKLEVIIQQHKFEQDAVQIVQFAGFFDRMNESNIWKLLPRLVSVGFNIPQESEFLSSRKSRQYYLYTKNGVKRVGNSDWLYDLHKI